ncbi:LOW QUALITY PROTEIN: charged multivesicular body protein 7-like [Neosynchiropus ocellatus]
MCPKPNLFFPQITELADVQMVKHFWDSSIEIQTLPSRGSMSVYPFMETPQSFDVKKRGLKLMRRMRYLFSAFKENREVNTMDWDFNMEFWTALVVQSCLSRRSSACPHGERWCCPSRCGKIQRESEFAANVDCGWLSWGVGLLLVKPLKWTFSTLLGSGRVSMEESFVVIELVKEKAAELLAAYRSSALATRSLVSFQELCVLCADVCADESTLCLALLQLQREKRVTVTLHDGDKIVKFCQPRQDRVSPVNDVDIGVYQLQCSERLLSERVDQLSAEAERCKEDARGLLREGKKSQALTCLRKKKRVEKRADSLCTQLESIRSILDRIAQSQTDKMVMQAYQAGVAAMRLSLKDGSVERAENLVDQIQELCDAQDELNQTLSRGPAGTDEDLDDLEEELKSLLEEPRPELPSTPARSAWEPSGPSSDLLDSLPAVPFSEPRISDEQLEEELNRLTLSGPRRDVKASVGGTVWVSCTTTPYQVT